jgi:hypothetical protein
LVSKTGVKIEPVTYHSAAGASNSGGCSSHEGAAGHAHPRNPGSVTIIR